MYDQLGLILLEHHPTQLITGIKLLGAEFGFLTTKQPYTGGISICGVELAIGDPVQNLDECDVSFFNLYRDIRFADIRSAATGGHRIGIAVQTRQACSDNPLECVITGVVLLLVREPDPKKAEP